MHNKIRVVRRQVTNSRRNSRLNRLLTAHKRQSNVHGHPQRQNSTENGDHPTHKVVEPYLKPVYGAVPDGSVLSTSPDMHHGTNENQPLLGGKK